MNSILRIISAILFVVAVIVQSKMAMIVIPVTIVDSKSIAINDLQKIYQINTKVATAIYNAHVTSGYPYKFIAELVLSESGFNPKAVSPKGYKGLLQTPTMTGYVNADIAHGIAILQEKFKQYKDPLDAIAAYKGGKDIPQARKQARDFLAKYEWRKGL